MGTPAATVRGLMRGLYGGDPDAVRLRLHPGAGRRERRLVRAMIREAEGMGKVRRAAVSAFGPEIVNLVLERIREQKPDLTPDETERLRRVAAKDLGAELASKWPEAMDCYSFFPDVYPDEAVEVRGTLAGVWYKADEVGLRPPDFWLEHVGGRWKVLSGSVEELARRNEYDMTGLMETAAAWLDRLARDIAAGRYKEMGQVTEEAAKAITPPRPDPDDKP